MPPIDVIQEQVSDRETPEAIGHHQEDHGIIAGADGRLGVDPLEHPIQGGVFDALGQGGMAILPDGRDQP